MYRERIKKRRKNVRTMGCLNAERETKGSIELVMRTRYYNNTQRYGNAVFHNYSPALKRNRVPNVIVTFVLSRKPGTPTHHRVLLCVKTKKNARLTP